MPNGDVIRDLNTAICFNVDNGKVLNIRALANRNGINIAAQNTIRPNAGIVTDFDFPLHHRGWMNENTFADLRFINLIFHKQYSNATLLKVQFLIRK